MHSQREEPVPSRNPEAPLPSNLQFGRFFSAVFAAAALYAYWKGAHLSATALLVLSALFATLAIYAPNRLAPMNRLWSYLGLFLGKIVNPIVLGFLFFVVLTPVSMVGRLFGRDALSLKRRVASSYWVDREVGRIEATSFKNQF